jgi:hypothetical protein
MTHWGDKYKPHKRGKRLIFVERATGKPIRQMSAVSSDGQPLRPRDIQAKAGPALDNKLLLRARE